MISESRCIRRLIFAAAALCAGPTLLHADLQPAWTARVPIGSSLSAGMGGFFLEASGVTYITGTSGSSSNTDITTAAVAADGSVIWTQTYNGPENWHDQARGLTLGPDGTLWVCGNTPGPGRYANVLALQYDAATGALLRTIQYSSGPFTSEHAASIAADAAGNVYIGGGTVGDGADVLMLSFTSSGALRWRRTWDGPAFGPYSQDHAQKVILHPDGTLIAMIDGVMGSLHADYVIIKYNPADGTTVWERYWGRQGDDFPNEMLFSAEGDIFVSGTALAPEGNDRYGTIRMRGSDGQLLWENYSGRDAHNAQRGLAIDDNGGVYVTGSVDPDGDRSNTNDNFYSVKLDAATGTQLWSHHYGANCVGCFDAPGGLVVDLAGNVFLAGSTSSAPYSGDVILFVLDAGTGAETDRGVISGSPTEAFGVGILRLDAFQNLYLGGGTYDVNTGEKDMTVTRFDALAASLALAVNATCPGGGPIRVEWSGATGGGQAALIFARNTGSFRIPDGNPCAGTVLGLGSNQIQLAWQGGAGANGSRILNASAGPGACGGHLQLLDISSCAVSNVARVE